MPRSTQHLGVDEPVQQLELDAARVEHGIEESVSGGARGVLGHGLSRRLDRASRGVKGISDAATLSSGAAADTRPVAEIRT